MSAHLSIPSGMGPPEHGPYRAIVERYFTPARMAAFEPARAPRYAAPPQGGFGRLWLRLER